MLAVPTRVRPTLSLASIKVTPSPKASAFASNLEIPDDTLIVDKFKTLPNDFNVTLVAPDVVLILSSVTNISLEP